jgi:hypothetical protein
MAGALKPGGGRISVHHRHREHHHDSRTQGAHDRHESYQLRKLKDVVLRCLNAGSKEALLSAFWEYVLLLEICGRVIDKDRELHKRDHKIFEPYQRLLKFYRDETSSVGVSISDRLLRLIERVSQSYADRFGTKEGIDLSDGHVTNLLYQTAFGLHPVRLTPA